MSGGTRLLVAARLVWAGLLFTRSDRLVRAVGGQPDATTRKVARILGVRHVLQGLAQWRWPDGGSKVGAGIDSLHALSMVALAALDPARRRPAAADAAVAGAMATASLAVQGSPKR